MNGGKWHKTVIQCVLALALSGPWRKLAIVDIHIGDPMKLSIFMYNFALKTTC